MGPAQRWLTNTVTMPMMPRKMTSLTKSSFIASANSGIRLGSASFTKRAIV